MPQTKAKVFFLGRERIPETEKGVAEHWAQENTPLSSSDGTAVQVNSVDWGFSSPFFLPTLGPLCQSHGKDIQACPLLCLAIGLGYSRPPPPRAVEPCGRPGSALFQGQPHSIL